MSEIARRHDQIKNWLNEYGKFIVSLKQTDDIVNRSRSSVIRSLYEDWLFNQANNIFQEKIKKFGEMVKVKPKEIAVKKLKNRWGSATSKGTINLNYNLMKAPEDVIDYVVIHELCHFKIRGHSHKFWSYVHKFVPNYEDIVTWLSINGKYLIS